MKKVIFIAGALLAGTFSSYGQAHHAANTKDTVVFDKSFLDAGTEAENVHEIALKPKFYKAGVLAPEQPIALSTAKEEALKLVKSVPSPLRKDCLNIIYTVEPIYTDGNITGAIKGTITIRWDIARRVWTFSYLKYQLINIDQNACVFMYETE